MSRDVESVSVYVVCALYYWYKRVKDRSTSRYNQPRNRDDVPYRRESVIRRDGCRKVVINAGSRRAQPAAHARSDYVNWAREVTSLESGETATQAHIDD